MSRLPLLSTERLAKYSRVRWSTRIRTTQDQVQRAASAPVASPVEPVAYHLAGGSWDRSDPTEGGERDGSLRSLSELSPATMSSVGAWSVQSPLERARQAQPPRPPSGPVAHSAK